ncbi:MAG: hypothetical protein ABL962_18665, partial [Fimbriimonadaceae bacterium]
MSFLSSLQKLFSKQQAVNYPGKGPTVFGRELKWERFGLLKVHSGKLFVGDGQMAPHEPGVIVDLEPGEYEVSRQKMDFDGDVRVALMRIVRKGVRFERGQKLGDSWADTATQGVCDYEIYKEAISHLTEEEYFTKFENELYVDDAEVVNLDPEKGAVLFITTSGWGDG